MNISSQKSGGGSATQAGIIFQNRVAAWLCTRILDEKDAELLWEWPASSTLEFIRCETEQPIDDLMVGTSEDAFAFINVKR